jgi:hypothetical protein
MSTLFLVTLILTAAGEPRWELAGEADQLKIYSRRHPGSEVLEMKAMGLIDASPQAVLAAISDYDRYPATMPYVVEAKVLKRPDASDPSTIFYSRVNLPLVSARDYLIRLVEESDWKDGKGYLKVRWTVVNDKDDLKPVPEDVIRIRVNDGYWILEPREGGRKTFTTYSIHSSPGGSIPTWIANKANTVAVPKVFEAVRKVVKASPASSPSPSPSNQTGSD